MAERPAFEAYVARLCDGNSALLSNVELAEEFGVDPATIWRWNRKVDWHFVKDQRRKNYSQATARIDEALIRKAEKGDTRAIDLYYQRFDEWVPTQHRIVTSSDDELLKRAKQLREQINSQLGAGGGANPPGVSEARA